MNRSEIDRILADRSSQSIRQIQNYQKNVNSSMSIHEGYVVHTNINNHLEYRYNVKVPDFSNETILNIPVMAPGGLNGANSVGYKNTLSIGQPVLVAFKNKSAASAFILGGVYLRGDVQQYKDGELPSTDSVDPKTGRAIFPPPNNFFSIKSGSEVTSWDFPLKIRSGSPVHGPDTSIGSEVPGSTVVYDRNGNKIELNIGKEYKFELDLSVLDTTGFKKSLANLPIEDALKTIDSFRRIINEQDEKFYDIATGKFVKKSDHPDKKTDPVNSEGTQAFKDILKTIDRYQSIASVLSSSGFLSGSQMKFLKNTVFKYSKILNDAWGASEEIGLILDKKVEVEDPGSDTDASAHASQGEYDGERSIPIRLGPVDINVSSEDTGKSIVDGLLSSGTKLLSNKLLDGNLSLIIGDGSGAPTPLTTEGEMILGGKKKIDEIIGVLDDKVLPIYRVLSTELNKLDFVNLPESKLVTKIFGMGVSRGRSIVRGVLKLAKAKSLFGAIEAIQQIVPPLIDTALALGTVRLGKDRETAIEELEDRSSKPSVQNCPILPARVYDAFLLAENEDDEGLSQFFSEVLYLDPVNFTQWVVDPTLITEWLASNDLPASEAMALLLDGKIFEFLVNVVSQESGVGDFNLFTRDINQLSIYNRRCFNLGVLGTEDIYGGS